MIPERALKMVKIGKKEKSDQLYKAILQLKDEQECYDFFQDLCTVSELREVLMSQAQRELLKNEKQKAQAKKRE